MRTPPIVAKDVDSWCTKCKMILAHTIEAVVDGRITRVHCNTCGGQHTYRPSAPGTAVAKSTRPRTARTTPSREVSQTKPYAELLTGRDAGAARPYSPAERFTPKELIRHASFGLGVVTALKDANKIEVLFADGTKILIHRRA